MPQAHHRNQERPGSSLREFLLVQLESSVHRRGCVSTLFRVPTPGMVAAAVNMFLPKQLQALNAGQAGHQKGPGWKTVVLGITARCQESFAGFGALTLSGQRRNFPQQGTGPACRQ